MYNLITQVRRLSTPDTRGHAVILIWLLQFLCHAYVAIHLIVIAHTHRYSYTDAYAYIHVKHIVLLVDTQHFCVAGVAAAAADASSVQCRPRYTNTQWQSSGI